MARSVLIILLGVLGWLAQWNTHTHACEVPVKTQEALKGIPKGLLQAISTVESGRHPWIINAAGQPYSFATKEEAIAKVAALLKKGITSIDIGCMQINLKHHPHAFSSLEEAFDPVKNVSYAAEFLHQLKKEKGSWTAAIAHYHSAHASHNIPYRNRVMRAWSKIMGGRTKDGFHSFIQQAIARQPAGHPAKVYPPNPRAGSFTTTVRRGEQKVPVRVGFSPLSHVPEGKKRISEESIPIQGFFLLKGHSESAQPIQAKYSIRRIPGPRQTVPPVSQKTRAGFFKIKPDKGKFYKLTN